MKSISEKILHRVEWIIALLLTSLCATLHFNFLRHAGGLWRDEVSAVNLAQMPTLTEVWNHLYLDSFPIFWVLAARVWWQLGLGSDFGYRVLGFFTGLLILGAIWFTVRCFKSRVPMFLLLLVGVNPLVIVYGDTMRAWGWGLFWLTLEFGLMWLVVESPKRWRVLCATLGAIAMVQSTYHNAVLLLVFCCGGVAVALRHGWWRRASLIVGIGAAGGLSLLPYLKIFQIGQDHYAITRRPFHFDQFVDKLLGALSGEEAFSQEVTDLRLWWIFLILVTVVLMACLFFPKQTKINPKQKDLLLFAFVLLVLAIPAFFAFLRELSLVTAPWYYLPLIMIVALALEAIFSVLENHERGRLFRLGIVLPVLCVLLPTAWDVVKLRMTNMALVAGHLNNAAAKNDLVVVTPYYYAIPFARDYTGSAPWVSLPMIDHRFTRYDVLAQLLSQTDRKAVIQDVLDKMVQTLKSGGRVWVVSGNVFSIGKISDEPFPPKRPDKLDLEESLRVLDYWPQAAAYILQEHCQHYQLVRIKSPDPVIWYERTSLTTTSGWHE